MLSLKGVPGMIRVFSSPRKKVQTKSGEQTLRDRCVAIDLDVTDPTFIKALDRVFPGVDMALKGAAKINDGTNKSPSFSWSVAKKYPELTIVGVAKDGNEKMRFTRAKPKGKPVLRVSAGVDDIAMPLEFNVAIDKDVIAKVLEWQDHDLLWTIEVTQIDIADADVDDDGDGKPSKPKGGKSKDKATLSIV